MKNKFYFTVSTTIATSICLVLKHIDAVQPSNPTIYEQLMPELVNRARANPGAEAARLGITLNQGLPAGTIENTPKQPLAFQSQLITAARGHSQWMLDEDIFSHTGVNGSNPRTRMETADYVFSRSWTYTCEKMNFRNRTTYDFCEHHQYQAAV